MNVIFQLLSLLILDPDRHPPLGISRNILDDSVPIDVKAAPPPVDKDVTHLVFGSMLYALLANAP